MKKTFSLPEWAKNLLIAALALSALYLFTLSPLYLNSPLRGWTGRLFARTAPGSGVSVSFTAASRPVRMAVSTGSGRLGVQYDTAAVDALFEQTGALLGEALGSAGEASPVTAARWQRALGEEGIYFDFSGAVPLAALAGWLQDGGGNVLLSGDARRMLLAPGDNGAVWLFYQDGQTDRFCARATALLVQEHLAPMVASFVPNGARFAFEDDRLSACYPYTLITDGPERAAVYEAASPLSSNGGALETALSALSFSGALVTSYTVDEGTVYRLGDDTLLLAPDGSLTYRSAEGALYPVAKSAEEPTLAEMIETTCQLTAAVLEPLCGDARPYLISARPEEGVARTQEEGHERILITYGYSLNGAQAWTLSGGWCAQFRFTDGALTSFTLRVRSYTPQEESAPLLPPVQAAAAMEAAGAGGSELLLVYQDTGERQMRPGWVAA